MTSGDRSELRLERFLPYVLNRLAEGVSAGLSRIYADEYQLSIPEWRVIANLAEHGSLNASQIIELTAMEKSKVSRAVSNLDARGLVSQRRAQGDNRAKDLALTKSGKALYAGMVPKVLAWESELLDGLRAGEYRDLIYLLDKLGARVKSLQ